MLGKMQGIDASGAPEHPGGIPEVMQGMPIAVHPGGNLMFPIRGKLNGGMGRQGRPAGIVIGQPGGMGLLKPSALGTQGIVRACAGGGAARVKDSTDSAARKKCFLPAIMRKNLSADRMRGCSRIRGLRTTTRRANWRRSCRPGAGNGIRGWGIRRQDIPYCPAPA